MRRLFALVLMLLTVGPVLAGNARSDRTALTFQRDQIRRQHQNAQWAQHFAAQRQPARFDQHGRPLNYAGQMQRVGERHQYNFTAWQNNGPRPQIPQVNGQVTTYRRR